jgi:release factor glutamine methyltransferase
MSRTAAQALQALTGALRDAAGEEAGQQARLLLCHVLRCAPAKLALHRDDALTPEQETEVQMLLSRRQNREPLQYLLGEWAFMGLDFLVRPGALIPRQDTETLCEIALREAKLQGTARRWICAAARAYRRQPREAGRAYRDGVRYIPGLRIAHAGERE